MLEYMGLVTPFCDLVPQVPRMTRIDRMRNQAVIKGRHSHMPRFFRLGLVTLALVAVPWSIGHAAVIVHEVSEPNPFTDPLLPTNWSTIIDVPQFDPELGVLCKVTLELTGVVQGSFRITHTGGDGFLYDVTVKSEISASAGGLTVSVSPESNSAVFLDLDPDTLDPNSAMDDLGDSLEDMVMTNPADDLSDFIGTETVALQLMATGLSVIQGSGNEDATISTNAGALARILYEYKFVPEPSSIVIWTLVGMIGLVAYRRRSI